ncbi:MAG: hypothetical protein NVS4B2_13380 [Chloroflexota bacterium]
MLDPAVVGGLQIADASRYLTNTCFANQGAGPFKFRCQNPRSGIDSFYSGRTPKYSLVPNPYFYGNKPRVNIQLPGYVTGAEGYRQYVAGGLEVSSVPPVYLRQWKGKSSQYREFPSPRLEYLVADTQLPPFNSVHCRLAVAYAIDRRLIAAHIRGGHSRAAYYLVPNGMLGHYGGGDNPHFNDARARAELAQCPGRTTPFTLSYWHISPELDNEYTAIGSMLTSIGMNAKLKPLNFDANFVATHEPLHRTNTQLIANLQGQDYHDPQDYCTLLLHSRQSRNIGGWHNAEYDRLVDRADVTWARRKRAALYIQAQHIALGHGAIIPLQVFLNQVIVKPYVHGLVDSEAIAWGVMPAHNDWSKVFVSKR